MRIVVAGAGGALGGHLVRRLLGDGYEVRAVDIKPADDWWQYDDRATNWDYADLRDREVCAAAVHEMQWVFNLACDMGGIGHIESHRADCMRSVLINTHLAWEAARADVDRYWYASSACVYPAEIQDNPLKGFDLLRENQAYPARPEAGYGEEKLFSEQMCRYIGEDLGLDVRIARLHNVYGPYSTWAGGREKAPAALCRKIAEAKITGSKALEIWGDGTRTRSFLYVDDFVEGALQIMNSDYPEPMNLGSEEVVSINVLADIIEEIAGTSLTRLYNTSAPRGVFGRGSDNRLLRQVTGWEPSISLRDGLAKLYPWVASKVEAELAVKR